MKKKILFVINNLCGGGAERVLINILENFPFEEADVDLLLFWRDGLYVKEINSNVKLHYIFGLIPKNTYLLLAERIILRIILLFPSLIYFFKLKKKYDVEVAFLEGLPAVFISRSLVRHSKKITWIHTNVTRNATPNAKLEDLAYKKMNGIVFVSNEIKDIFIKKHPTVDRSLMITLYNPADTSSILMQSLESCPIKFDELAFNIISIGRLSHQKGFDRLIKVADILVNVRKIDSIKFYILGGGELENELQQFIYERNLSTHVILLGFLDNPFSYLAQADLFFLSSRSEGFPMALLESKILSIPSLSASCSGVSEAIVDGVNGFIVTNDNDTKFISEAADKICYLYTDKDRLSKVENVLMNEEKYNKNIQEIYLFLINK